MISIEDYGRSMIELSVVLISRNQEWNIARLVESVLRETGSTPAREVVLVDSASTDRTREIAAHYPISVLKLDPDQRLSAAAGRYVGYKWSTGDLVLFLDGDMELYEGWLDHALGIMHTRSNVGALCGLVIDRPKEFQTTNKENHTPSVDHREPSGSEDSGVDVKQGGGAAMYRRSVLEQVGTFNPYLYADEEPELCLRIRHAGYRVFQLSHPIAFHYSVTFHTFSNFLDKRRHKFFLGYGQNIRYFLNSPLVWPYLKERGWAMFPALIICLGLIAAVASVLSSQWIWVALWAAFLIVLTLVMTIRKHSLKRALLTLFLRLLILEGAVRGFFLKPNDPASYPGKYDIVQ
jgi:glycosyltransferase involved in cell wall biosynthesis